MFDPDTDSIDLDNRFDSHSLVRYIGVARRRFDARGNERWECVAEVGGALCLVEVKAVPLVIVDHDPGDDQRYVARPR
jgi:hypothetical protein